MDGRLASIVRLLSSRPGKRSRPIEPEQHERQQQRERLTPSAMSSDELVPLQTCQRLVHYRGFGGDADFAEVAVKEDAWKGKDGGKKKGKGGKEAPEPGARNSGRARNFCAPLSPP